MTTEVAFLSAIREEPELDTPRLVYADWLIDQGKLDRAEFIRVQIELSHGVPDRGLAVELLRRLRALMVAHRQEWLGPLQSLAPEALFERGFVEEVSLPAQQFLKYAEELLEAHPLTRLHVQPFGRFLAKFPSSSTLEGLTHLSFREPRLGDRGYRALAHSPYLKKLRMLDLSSSPPESVQGLLDLVRSPNLPALSTLILAHNGLGDLMVQRLLESLSLPSLRKLDLSGNGLTSRSAMLFAQCPNLLSLTSLRLACNRFSADDVPLLVGSPNLANLVVLDLMANNIRYDTARTLRHRFGSHLVC